MTDAHLFAIGVVLAWLAGIRVYLTVFGVGLAGAFGWLDLPQALEVTASPWVIGISGALAVAEFFADKIPGVDTGWDLLHTLLRVPAGAFLAAATLGGDGGDLGAGALATGAGLAAHAPTGRQARGQALAVGVGGLQPLGQLPPPSGGQRLPQHQQISGGGAQYISIVPIQAAQFGGGQPGHGPDQSVP